VSLLYFYHLYVYSLFLSVSLPALANKVVHYRVICPRSTTCPRPIIAQRLSDKHAVFLVSCTVWVP